MPRGLESIYCKALVEKVFALFVDDLSVQTLSPRHDAPRRTGDVANRHQICLATFKLHHVDMSLNV